MIGARDVLLAARREVSGASAAIFRIGFGAVGALLVARFFAMGWIEALYVDPAFHFPYPGFEWVRPWPGPGMYLHFAVMGLAALGITLGYRHRLSSLLFSACLGYAELIDRTLYLNHYYWMVITAAVMAFLPLHHRFSLDVRQGRAQPAAIPAGAIWLLRFQVGMVYFFAGLAKLNSDWLLRGEPLATWLPARADLPLVGPLLAVPMTAMVLSWAGALFDLTIVLWLSVRRTRSIAFLVVIGFHATTWLLFPSIGLFPLLMVLGATILFPPDWPDRWANAEAVPVVEADGRRPVWWPVVVAGYCLVMLALPLRHYLAPGDVKWTSEGYLGSWQVMLSEKAGSVEFVVKDPDTDVTWRVPPPEYLTARQRAVMATDPTMIEQTARHVSEELGGVVVAADARLSFNGRASTRFTDPETPIWPKTSETRAWLLSEPSG